jgi:hypothetical protein
MASLTGEDMGPLDFAAVATEEEARAMMEILKEEGIIALSEEGYVECPGKELHTTTNEPDNCRIFFNQRENFWAPFLYCFHRSCLQRLQDCNHRMCYQAARRAALRGGGSAPFRAGKKHKTTPSSINLDKVKAEFGWTLKEIEEHPEFRVDVPENLQHLLLFRLFEPDEVLWVADELWQSGPGFRDHFRRISDLIADGANSGRYTCPSTFIEGACHRKKEMVQTPKYLVVESDSLTHDESGAVFNWMKQQGYVLRAVVDTGNKSLHGWFDRPSEEVIPSLKRDLIHLGCDPKMFGLSQPCRLPGVIRPETGKFQRLIYFNNPNYNPQ